MANQKRQDERRNWAGQPIATSCDRCAHQEINHGPNSAGACRVAGCSCEAFRQVKRCVKCDAVIDDPQVEGDERCAGCADPGDDSDHCPDCGREIDTSKPACTCTYTDDEESAAAVAASLRRSPEDAYRKMTDEQADRFVLGEVPSVADLVGAVERVETRPHRCPTTGRCTHSSHRRDPRVYLSDRRALGRRTWDAHHLSNGTWVSYRCEPTKECRDAYEQVAGRPPGPFDMSALELITWRDHGLTVLIGRPRNHIGSTFIAWSRNHGGGA